MQHLRHSLNKSLIPQNCVGTGEDKKIEKEKDVQRYVGGMPQLTDLCLAFRTDQGLQ